jgi:hypothetical protein
LDKRRVDASTVTVRSSADDRLRGKRVVVAAVTGEGGFDRDVAIRARAEDEIGGESTVDDEVSSE